MKNTWIIEHKDYLGILNKCLSMNSSIRGYRSRLAKAMGCQPAYLSHVLSGQAELTLEHGLAATQFWGFDHLERDYFLARLSCDRAGTMELRQHFHEQIENLKERIQKRAKNQVSIETQIVSKEQVAKYYFDWITSAVHMILTCPGPHDFRSISKKLQVGETKILRALQILKDIGLIKERNGQLFLTEKMIHASDASDFSHLHHRNWRSQAIRKFEAGVQKPDYQFTGVVSLDPKTFTEIRSLLQKQLEETKERVRAAREERIACLNVDWFYVDEES